MPPPREPSADQPPAQQTPAQIAAAIESFLTKHPQVTALEDGKPLFDLRTAKHSLTTTDDRCTLQLWDTQQNLARHIVSFEHRGQSLRLATARLGQKQTKLLELSAAKQTRTKTSREAARTHYLRLLERVLTRNFPDWQPEGFRAAMDLERSFGPAYIRGSLTQGNRAWAVIGVSAAESLAIVDGILTLGILWLEHSRTHAAGKRLYTGLKVIVPRGAALTTLSRMAWLNDQMAQWELYELDESTEELTQREPTDTGNLRTRLVHHPDEAAAAERFTDAITTVLNLVPPGEEHRVEQRLRSTSELGFLLHGLEFARARIGVTPNSFAHTLEITAGVGPRETSLNDATRNAITTHIAELFERRRAFVPSVDFGRRGATLARRIGPGSPHAAHSRLNLGTRPRRGPNPTQDPLYRAAPERWLESVLRKDLAPLTRSLSHAPQLAAARTRDQYANEEDLDNIGNRAADVPSTQHAARESKAIPRLDPHHVYSQVPAIAGSSDRGMLDLLGVTAEGRLAVIELKADEDLHFALQGLDYWMRVRHHHLQQPDALTNMGEFQRHGYFRGIELAAQPPRLYLVAPALRIHPATEKILRYFSPRVEWTLLALDERWRQSVRVVWRRSGGRATP